MKKVAGLTLIELLLGLALMAIVLFFCNPFAESVFKKNQLELLVDEIKSAIHYAKTEVLLHGESLLLAPLAGSDDWSTGMMLFVDNKAHQYHEGSKLIHEWHWRPSDFIISWQGFQSNQYLLFATDISRSAVNGHFLIKNNSLQHQLIVNRLGRVKCSAEYYPR